MVKVIFSFVNSDRHLEATFEGTQSISAVKEKLLREKWPPSQGDPAAVQKLRFFSMGKELVDKTKLSQIRLTNAEGPLPILVHVTRPEWDITTNGGLHYYCCGCILV